MLSKAQLEELILGAGLVVDLESPIPTDREFSDLGLDSLDVYNIFVEIEVQTSVEIPDSEIENLKTIDSLHAYLAAQDA